MIPATYNQLSNTHNPFQSKRKKILTVCSAGLLRSPTLAWILSNKPFDFNTRACGINEEYALIPISEALIEWADEIVVVEAYMKTIIHKHSPDSIVHVIEIPDQFETRSPELITIATRKLKELYEVN
jgi:predicted protein tyrosine phosphatase